jgi:hypothetical protein
VGAAMGSPVAKAQPAAGSVPRIGCVTPPPPAGSQARRAPPSGRRVESRDG